MLENEPTSPLTGSPHVRLVNQKRVDQIVRDWRQHLGIEVEDELRGTTSIALFECLESGLRFFLPADVVGSAKLYSQLQKFDWYYMADKWEHSIALQDLRGCR